MPSMFILAMLLTLPFLAAQARAAEMGPIAPGDQSYPALRDPDCLRFLQGGFDEAAVARLDRALRERDRHAYACLRMAPPSVAAKAAPALWESLNSSLAGRARWPTREHAERARITAPLLVHAARADPVVAAKLLKAFDSWPISVRIESAGDLGLLGDAFLPSLMRLFAGDDPNTWGVAAEAMSNLGPRIEPALPEIARIAVAPGNLSVRRPAPERMAELLAKARADQGAPVDPLEALRWISRDPKQPEDLRRAAGDAASAIAESHRTGRRRYALGLLADQGARSRDYLGALRSVSADPQVPEDLRVAAGDVVSAISASLRVEEERPGAAVARAHPRLVLIGEWDPGQRLATYRVNAMSADWREAAYPLVQSRDGGRRSDPTALKEFYFFLATLPAFHVDGQYAGRVRSVRYLRPAQNDESVEFTVSAAVPYIDDRYVLGFFSATAIGKFSAAPPPRALQKPVAAVIEEHLRRKRAALEPANRKEWSCGGPRPCISPDSSRRARTHPWSCTPHKSAAGWAFNLALTAPAKTRDYLIASLPSCAPGEYLEDGAAVLDVRGERPSIVSHTGEDSALPAFDIDGDGFPEFIGWRGVGGTAFPTLVRMFPRYAPLATACCRF